MVKRINFLNSDSSDKQISGVGGLFKIFGGKKNKSNRSELGSSNKKTKFFTKIFSKRLILSLLSVAIVFFTAIVIVAYFFLFLPLRETYEGVKELQSKFTAINQGIEDENFTLIKESILNVKKELEVFEDEYKENFKYVRHFPFMKDYYQDAEVLINVGKQSTDLGVLVVDVLEPFAKDIGFKVDGQKGVSVTAQERVIRLIKLMPEFSSEVNKISDRVVNIDRELSKIDASRYPTRLPIFVEQFGIDSNLDLQGQILAVQSISHEVAGKSPQFEALFNSLPEFMGVNEPKRYLIIMANNNEIRMSGGFNTYVAVVELSEGIPEILMSMDTYFIDEGDRLRSSALVSRNVPYHLSRYLYIQGRGSRLYARDATSTYPDFERATDVLVNEFWVKDRTLPQDLNGVIQVNNDVIVNLLEVLGPVSTESFSIVTDQKSRITIPVKEFNSENVIYELTDIAGGKLAETIGRKDIIKFLAQSMLQKMFTSRATNLTHIGRVLLESLSRKDVILRSFNPSVQNAFDGLGYSGQLKNIDGSHDYLHVNRSNYGAGKSDWTKPGFVTQEISKTTFVENGKAISNVTVTIKNPKRPDWFDIDPCCFYNAYLRVYVPYGSKLVQVVSSDGQDVNSAEYNDDHLNLTYFETYTRQEKETNLDIMFEYELPPSVNLEDYKVFVQRQPGTSVDPIEIQYNDIMKSGFLNADHLYEF